MRAFVQGGLAAAAALTLILPAAASAQTGGTWVLADNPSVTCLLPLPEMMVTGELGSVIQVDDPQDIDKVTLGSDYEVELLSVDWHDGAHQATITASADLSAYIVWSCAPLNGEPVQQNDPQEV